MTLRSHQQRELARIDQELAEDPNLTQVASMFPEPARETYCDWPSHARLRSLADRPGGLVVALTSAIATVAGLVSALVVSALGLALLTAALTATAVVTVIALAVTTAADNHHAHPQSVDQ
jgi:hypothetical protein